MSDLHPLSEAWANNRTKHDVKLQGSGWIQFDRALVLSLTGATIWMWVKLAPKLLALV